MNEMNDKCTIEVIKGGNLACWWVVAKKVISRSLITGLLLRGIFIWNPIFRSKI